MEVEDEDNVIPGDAVRTVLAFRGSANRPVVVPQEVAMDAERIYRCHVKKLSGMTWNEVARAEGFPNAASCRYQVERYLAEARDLVEQYTAKQMLANEIMLLDYLQTKLWTAVEIGDRQAIETVVKIAEKRVVWQNLEVKDDARVTEVHTIVVPGDDYTTYLKQAAAKAEITESSAQPGSQTVPSSVSQDTDEEAS